MSAVRRHAGSRTLTVIPPPQKKKPGPPFGTESGRGLTLTERSGGSAAHQPIRSCPDVLEMRGVRQHRPIDTALKDTVDARLKVRRPDVVRRSRLFLQDGDKC